MKNKFRKLFMKLNEDYHNPFDHLLLLKSNPLKNKNLMFPENMIKTPYLHLIGQDDSVTLEAWAKEVYKENIELFRNVTEEDFVNFVVYGK